VGAVVTSRTIPVSLMALRLSSQSPDMTLTYDWSDIILFIDQNHFEITKLSPSLLLPDPELLLVSLDPLLLSLLLPVFSPCQFHIKLPPLFEFSCIPITSAGVINIIVFVSFLRVKIVPPTKWGLVFFFLLVSLFSCLFF
jgi:hypothetical protein